MKYILWGALFILLSGCVNRQGHVMGDTASLPKKCGNYDVHYGVPQGLEWDDGTVGKPIMLNGKNMGYLDVKYVGKEVAVFTWIQVVGGLPMPDGSGGEAIYYYNPEKVLLLRGEYNLLNRDVIEDACNELKRKS